MCRPVVRYNPADRHSARSPPPLANRNRPQKHTIVGKGRVLFPKANRSSIRLSIAKSGAGRARRLAVEIDRISGREFGMQREPSLAPPLVRSQAAVLRAFGKYP